MRKFMLALVALMISLNVFAQNAIKVEAPNVVESDEQFNVTFIIEGEESVSDFQWSQGDDFQLVWGPQRGHSSSTYISNGKRTRSSQSTYTYILIPKKTGSLTIPVAKATVGGKSISSNPQKIDVVSGGSSRPSQGGSSASSGSSPSSSSSSGEIPSDDLFIKLTLSRTNLVVGEPVTATLKLYQRVNIAGFENAKFPSFNGFWSQEVLAPTNIDFQRENYNDKIYNSAVLRSYVLIPQQTGTLTIDPAELVCLVNVRTTSAPMSIFDSFFQDDYRTIRKRITTNPVKVNVSALPAGAPSSFAGGVGSYSMNASVSKSELNAHDASSLVITISGKGNVALLEAPKVNFPPDFEVYDTKSSQNTDKSSGATSGSKTFEYPFIPRSAGEFTIDPIEYSYYDVNAGKYVTLKSEPLSISVARGNSSQDASSSSPMVVTNPNRKDVKNLGNDIRFITTKVPALSSGGSFFLGSGVFWCLLVLLLVAAAAVVVVLNKISQRKADVAGTKNRKATKMAQKRLSQAQQYLTKNLYTAFYEELHKALLGFVSDKLNMDMADLSKDRISEALAAGGVPEQAVSQFVSLLDACEFARYAPDAGHEAMNAHFDDAVNVISSIDSSMKAKKSNSAKALVSAVILLIGIPAIGNAANDAYLDSLWNSAVSSYTEGEFEQAASQWQNIYSLGIESAELYYNLGNAWFKAGEYSKAIINYERALKLDPSYSDARYNLDFANSLIQDKIEPVPEFILKTFGRKVSYLMDSNAWAVMFLVLLAAALAMAVVFIMSESRSTRKLGFFSAIALAVLALSSLGFSAWQKSDYIKADSAIVTSAVASVKSSPSAEGSMDLFVLHEGTKVTLKDEVGQWKNIELADGRQGWIKSSDLEVI